MKRLTVITMVMALLAAMFAVVPAQGADQSVTGQVIVPAGGSYPEFSGQLSLAADGTISGNWQWVPFDFCAHGVRFRITAISSLAFPDENTAVFTGTFVCTDLPVILYSPEGLTCELTFIITEGTVDPTYNPGRLMVALPLDVHLPLGFDYGMGQGKMLVYNADGVLLADQVGDYQVNVYNR